MSIWTWSMKLRFQIGSNSPLANRNARMFCAASLPRKWSIRKIWLSSERLVHLVVELDRAVQVGAERLLHHHPGALDQVGVAQHGDHGERGLGRHAQVVQPRHVRRRARPRPRPPPRPAPPARRSAARSEVARRTPSHCSLGQRPGAELVDAPAGRTRGSSSVLMSSSEVPTTWMSGASADSARWASPGSSLRRARSPVAPNSTMTWGASGSR